MNFRKTLLCIFLAMVLVFTGCNQSDANTEENVVVDTGKGSITVEVIGETPFEFTNEDARETGPVEITAAQKDKDALLESATYTGILFNDFLDHIGVDKFSVISIEAADGYMQEFELSDISTDGTGLSWAVNGEILDEGSGPVMLVNHGRGPKWWIKQVSKITIIK